MRKGLNWGLSSVQEGELWIQLGLSSEATSSWGLPCDHWSYIISWEVGQRRRSLDSFVSVSVNSMRDDKLEWAATRGEDNATLLPGFVLSCTRPTAVSGSGPQETVSIIFTKEARRSPDDLKAPKALNNGFNLVSTDTFARHQALCISSHNHHVIPKVGTFTFPVYRGENWAADRLRLSRKFNKVSEHPPQPSKGQSDPL